MIPAHIQDLLNRLHAESLRQERAIPPDQLKSIHATYAQDAEDGKSQLDALMLDKFIALDQDKSLCLYHLLLANRATVVVEAGTSFGVSTIYLALAVAKNMKYVTGGARAKVIATEKEAPKAARAREVWKQCGPEVEKWIELREGDLEETLNGDLGLQEGQHVDALLLDIWPYVALPALKLVQTRMRPGSIVITDNTITSSDRYKDLFRVLRDPQGPWTSMTLPYSGGLELSVYML